MEKESKGKNGTVYEFSKLSDFGSRTTMQYYLISSPENLNVDKDYKQKLQMFKKYIWDTHALFLSINISEKNGLNVIDVCMMRLTDEKYYELAKIDPEEMLDFFKPGNVYETKYKNILM